MSGAKIKPRPFLIDKGSIVETKLIRIAEQERMRLHIFKNYGLISDEEYERRIAATYQPEDGAGGWYHPEGSDGA